MKILTLSFFVIIAIGEIQAAAAEEKIRADNKCQCKYCQDLRCKNSPNCIRRDTINNIRVNQGKLTGVDYEGDIVSDIQLNGNDIEKTSMRARAIDHVGIRGNGISKTHLQGNNTLHEVHFYGNGLKETKIEGGEITSIFVSGNVIRSTTINGTLSVSEVRLRGNTVSDCSIEGPDTNDVRISGYRIRRSTIAGANVRNVNIKASDIERVFINGSIVNGVVVKAVKQNDFWNQRPNFPKPGIDEVHITGTDRLDNVVIDGRVAYVYEVNVNQIKVNQDRDSYLLECKASYGWPEGTDITAPSSCDTQLCQSQCVSGGFQEGSCYSHTCCCITE